MARRRIQRFACGVIAALCALLPTAAYASGFALVELYTSEGCSSCPPADALAAELARDAARERTPVYVLAFHVDYWDRLGWRDPYGDPAHSERQALYAGRFQPRYTPQMVVNGAEAFVGSDRTRAKRTIAAALAVPPGLRLDARLESSPEAETLRVVWSVSGAGHNTRIHAALVEDGLESRVERGENRGRTLRHAGVVRAFATASEAGAEQGGVDLRVPADVRRAHARIVAFAQDAKSNRILAATAVELGPGQSDAGTTRDWHAGAHTGN